MISCCLYIPGTCICACSRQLFINTRIRYAILVCNVHTHKPILARSVVNRLKDRRALPEDDRFETFSDENEAHSMVIAETFAEDSGYYSCVAVNAAGTAVSENQLLVECKC